MGPATPTVFHNLQTVPPPPEPSPSPPSGGRRATPGMFAGHRRLCRATPVVDGATTALHDPEGPADMTAPTPPQAAADTFWDESALRRPIAVSTVPTVVDEVTVRIVAAAVVTIGVVALATGAWWLYAFLLTDFTIRAARGPRWSPIARVASTWIRPLVPAPDKPTAFAPKRFAAGIGAAMTAAITVLWLVSLATATDGPLIVASVLAVAMTVLPAAEAALGLCLGCKIFAGLIRVGLVPADVCVDCAPQRAA